MIKVLRQLRAAFFQSNHGDNGAPKFPGDQPVTNR